MSRWPSTIAACTNSRALMVRTSPRTTRAIGGQLTVAMAMTRRAGRGREDGDQHDGEDEGRDGLEELA